MKDFINDIGKKKLLIILGSIVGAIVLIIIILLLYNAFFKKNSYSSVEDKVLQAAKKYYSDNANLLPKNINDEVSINSTTLTSGDYLKSLDELVPDKNVNCTATVTVTKISDSYRYVSKLKCGEKYETKAIADYIKSNENTVISGQGLYEMNGDLVYRGDNPNNNVSFAGKKWNIVKIENGQLELILSEKLTRVTWDDRFNIERNQDDGINNYSVSRANDYLTNLYNSDELIKGNDKLVVAAHNLYIGKRSADVSYNDGSIEKSEIMENKYIGLLPLFDYINASLDSDCLSASTQSCANYNYLGSFGYNWWTMTGDSDTTHKVYRINTDGKISLSRASTTVYARPVIYLAKDAVYVKGNGTTSNPYVVK